MSELHFGGPDCPPRFLRDLLQSRVEAVPAGGTIAWTTYYFRDRALAEALIAASDRGVRVTLRIEQRPRRISTNRAVIAILAAHGLRGGLLPYAPRGILARLTRPHLHEKIYAFSHPAPHALTGSFNPSGDDPEDPEVVAEIGDQDCGHNLLVEFAEPPLVEALVAHIRRGPRFFDRLRVGPTVRDGAVELFFYPRLDVRKIEAELASLGPGSALRGAISHLKQGSLARALAAAARRGAAIDLLVHDTARRVPQGVLTFLASAGVSVTRYANPGKLPLHAKFLVIRREGTSTAWLGSFNFNIRSQLFNHEILVRSCDPATCQALWDRFDAIAEENYPAVAVTM